MDVGARARHERFLRMAVGLARENVVRGGRPFGAVIVRDGVIVATGVNEIVETHDPSAHAEMQAVRSAALAQRSPRFEGCVMYASGHPCPMCLALLHMTGFVEVYFAYSNAEAEVFGLSTRVIYEQMALPLAAQRIVVAHLPVEGGEVGDEEPLYDVWRRQSEGAS